MRYAKEVAYCFEQITKHRADRATFYATPRTTIRITRVKKQINRFVVTVGRPNYLERANLAKWRREGCPLSSIDIVLFFNKKGR